MSLYTREKIGVGIETKSPSKYGGENIIFWGGKYDIRIGERVLRKKILGSGKTDICNEKNARIITNDIKTENMIFIKSKDYMKVL